MSTPVGWSEKRLDPLADILMRRNSSARATVRSHAYWSLLAEPIVARVSFFDIRLAST